MKQYLLTWYGMTDLRAALGLEDTDGPVVSALKTGDYSDVVILAYTDAEKDQRVLADEVRKEWEGWSSTPLSTRRSLSRDETQRFLDALSNTRTGHDLFVAWLRDQLAVRGVTSAIQVLAQELKQLNDAPAIYNAAAAALRVALDDPDDKQITAYVSPGTPVMAYTWALIARSNPQLSIGVVSSSDPRRPPERIELPRALLDSSIRAPVSVGEDRSDYSLVVHLLGEQTIPVFFGRRQFRANEHVILTTKEYEPVARRLADSLGISPDPVIIRDPFKPADTRKAIAKLLGDRPPESRVAVNMTGGTKLMFAGALSACWELGLDPFYLEIRHHNVIFLRDGTSVPFVGISDVEDFLKAGDFGVISAGRWNTNPARDARSTLTRELWTKRYALGGLYKMREFRAFPDQSRRSRPDPFDFRWSKGHATLDKGGNATLVLDGDSLQVPKANDVFQYLAGGWLEEYVYSLLSPLEEEGIVRDVRVGLEVGYRVSEESQGARQAQEFDCTFTDGKRLWILECKAGGVMQAHVQKLENSLRTYGGVAARGLLISSFAIPDSQVERINHVPAVSAIQGYDLSTETLRNVVLTA